MKAYFKTPYTPYAVLAVDEDEKTLHRTYFYENGDRTRYVKSAIKNLSTYKRFLESLGYIEITESEFLAQLL